MSALIDLNKDISLCRLCEIAKTRTKSVPGEGAENAEIMFIGEAPGWHEDQQGRPFIGPAGQFLDELLASGTDIDAVALCTPPQVRRAQAAAPSSAEARFKACAGSAGVARRNAVPMAK